MTTPPSAPPDVPLDPVAASPARRRRLGRRRVSRRGVLALGGGAVLGAALTGGGVVLERSVSGGSSATDSSSAIAVRRYASTMLTAPRSTSWRRAGATPAPGYLFATPHADVFQGVIMDDDGEPVWIEPDGSNVTDLRVQQYAGRPVLTYWTGRTTGGHGLGTGVVKDTSYRTVATVRAGRGLIADLHEFQLTEQGTALLTAYPVVATDLRAVGGPRDGYVYDGRVQEVDVATGEVLLDWSALAHLDLSESYQPLTTSADPTSGDGRSPATAWDPVHVNAAEVDPVGSSAAAAGSRVLISARHTHSVYAVGRTSGDVQWRLGGRRSDFAVEDAAAFAWQHDVRRHADGAISLFDNHAKSGTAASAGLVLDVDEDAMTASLRRAYRYAGHHGGAEGSVQLLDGGHVLIGWGTDNVATEFTADGTAIYEARGLGDSSYRVYRGSWSATPTTAPDLAVARTDDGRLRVSASWNGATAVHSWRVLTGRRPDALSTAATVRRTGFETSVVVPASARVAVAALDADGSVLSTSRVRSATG